MTTPKMTADELAAGTAALKAMIAKSLPAWQQRLVPADLLTQAVTVIVTAVDTVRDAGAK